MRTVLHQLLELGLNSTEVAMAEDAMQRAPRQSSPFEVGPRLVTRRIQQRLGLPVTGLVDARTNQRMMELYSVDWMHRSWSEVIEGVLRLQKPLGDATETAAIATVGVITLFGLIQWGLAGYGLYSLFKNSKK